MGFRLPTQLRGKAEMADLVSYLSTFPRCALFRSSVVTLGTEIYNAQSRDS